MLASLVGARDVLELGAFTGYSALSFAEGVSADGRVITCEKDEDVAGLAQRFFSQSPLAHKVRIEEWGVKIKER